MPYLRLHPGLSNDALTALGFSPAKQSGFSRKDREFCGRNGGSHVSDDVSGPEMTFEIFLSTITEENFRYFYFCRRFGRKNVDQNVSDDDYGAKTP